MRQNRPSFLIAKFTQPTTVLNSPIGSSLQLMRLNNTSDIRNQKLPDFLF